MIIASQMAAPMEGGMVQLIFPQLATLNLGGLAEVQGLPWIVRVLIGDVPIIIFNSRKAPIELGTLQAVYDFLLRKLGD